MITALVSGQRFFPFRIAHLLKVHQVPTNLLAFSNPLSNPICPCLQRSVRGVVDFALSKHCSAGASQPELPAVGFGVEDYHHYSCR